MQEHQQKINLDYSHTSIAKRHEHTEMPSLNRSYMDDGARNKYHKIGAHKKRLTINQEAFHNVNSNTHLTTTSREKEVRKRELDE